MSSQNSDFTRKLRAAVRAKIVEYGIDVDEELPDYVMIMVGNKKDKVRMKTDLKLFLGDNTSDFVEWLFGFFQKIKAATAPSSTVSATTKTQVFEKNAHQDAKDNNKHANEEDDVKGSKSRKQTEKLRKIKNRHNGRREELSSKEKGNKLASLSISQNRNHHHKQKIQKRSSSRDSLSLEEEEEHSQQKLTKHSATAFLNKKKPESQSTNNVTFALPRQILRSVVVQPSHPRIYARTISPIMQMKTSSPVSQKNESEQQHSSPQTQLTYDEPIIAESVGKFAESQLKQEPIDGELLRKTKRRVLATNSMLLFQRAVNQSTTASNILSKEKSTMLEHDKEIQERERANLDTKRIVIRPTSITTELEDQEQQQNEPQIIQKTSTSRTTITANVVPGGIFKKAIFDAKRQSNVQNLTTVIHSDLSEKHQGIKRLADNELPIITNDDNGEEMQSNKKIRIELDADEQNDESNNKGEADSILVVNFDKPATRSIRKELKKPKSSLSLLKQHIGVVTTESTATSMEGKATDDEHQKVTLPIPIEKDSSQNVIESVRLETVENKNDNEVSEKSKILSSTSTSISTVMRVNTNTTSVITKSNSATAPLWDGRIEIEDDTSSIDDDEAEIDALLAEQHKLKQMALQREREMKERELPPTTALTRPLFYQSLPSNIASSSSYISISPKDADLLPAMLFPPQHTLHSHRQQQILPQQIPLIGHQPNLLVQSELTKQQQQRPCTMVATVAPTITVQSHATTAPVSMILPQQQNTTAIFAPQYSHPYANSSANPYPTTPYQKIHHHKANILKQQWCSFSKTYTISSPMFLKAGNMQVTEKADLPTKLKLMQLREQHRTKTSEYGRRLAEQKQLLGQLRQLTTVVNNNQNDKNNTEKEQEEKKQLLSRIKLMDKSAQELKAEIEQLGDQISQITGGGGSGAAGAKMMTV